MALPPLATEEELRAYPGVSPQITTAQALLVLRIASGAIRRATKQTLTFVENETVILEGGQQVLSLPQRPLVVDDDHPLTVWEIPDGTGIEVPALENRDFIRKGSELEHGQPLYQPTRFAGWPRTGPLGIWADRVKVIYSHGFQEIPDELVGICLDLAAATLANPRRLRSETAGQTSVTHTVETFGTGSLTADHRDILKGFTRSTLSVRQS